MIYETDRLGLANAFNLLVQKYRVGIVCLFKRSFYIERSVGLREFEQFFYTENSA